LSAVGRRLFGILAAVALASGATAQNNIEPVADRKPVENLVRRLFALSNQKQLGSVEGQSLRSGEMSKAQMTSFGALPDPDKIIMMTEGNAVVRIPAMDKQPDLYLFAARDASGSWTWNAYRSLALTGMLENLRNALRKKSPLTATEAATLRNVELTLSSDKQLIAWFAAHRPELDAIRLKTRPKRPINSRNKSADARRLAGLGLSFSALSDDVTSITIGGMVDNEVGYMFAPLGKVPAISADRYIWIEPLGDGWYLYKTT
jgi:hypothetical protein